jgi:hypothetical protein
LSSRWAQRQRYPHAAALDGLKDRPYSHAAALDGFRDRPYSHAATLNSPKDRPYSHDTAVVEHEDQAPFEESLCSREFEDMTNLNIKQR